MHAPSWDRETFAKTWEQVMEEADLSQAELAQMTGAASQASVSRWAKAQVRPSHDALRRLVDTLTRRYPKLGDLPARLLAAAGYGDAYVPPVDEEVEAVRQAAAQIEDAARRDRVESLIERSLREMEEDQQKRLRQLRDIIGLAKDESD